MTGCFITILFAAGAVFVMASLLRWFEQTVMAVDDGQWNKLAILVVFPFAAWMYPSRISAGRPRAVPRHEPVRGFGKAPPVRAEPEPPTGQPKLESAPAPTDEPPPGTPPEFIGLPKIPPKKPKTAIDPEKLAKLKQKMREQGMLDD